MGRKKEKEAILMNFIFEHHPNWDILYDIGIDFFSVAKISQDSTPDTVAQLAKKNAKSHAKES